MLSDKENISKETSELTAEIARHKQHSEEVQKGKSKIAQAIPPAEGSDAHTISERQLLQEMQSQFQNEAQLGLRLSPANHIIQNNQPSLPVGLNLIQLMDQMQDEQNRIEQTLQRLRESENVSIGEMFVLQMQMNNLSQLSEQLSNLSPLNQMLMRR